MSLYTLYTLIRRMQFINHKFDITDVKRKQMIKINLAQPNPLTIRFFIFASHFFISLHKSSSRRSDDISLIVLTYKFTFPNE